jgi:transcriptional regulator of nitric oxide reductase
MKRCITSKSSELEFRSNTGEVRSRFIALVLGSRALLAVGILLLGERSYHDERVKTQQEIFLHVRIGSEIFKGNICRLADL